MAKLKLYQEMRRIVGNNEIDLEVDKDKTIGGILNKLVEKYPPLKSKIFDENGDLNGYVNVFINGRNIMTKDGLETIIKEEDRVSLFPPLGGG